MHLRFNTALFLTFEIIDLVHWKFFCPIYLFLVKLSYRNAIWLVSVSLKLCMGSFIWKWMGIVPVITWIAVVAIILYADATVIDAVL